MVVKRRITTTFELPRDIMLDWPSIRIMGDEELVLSNHKGIAEYTKEQIRIKTGVGAIKISGRGLVIKEISREDIVVEGKIGAVVFRDK
jgi:sporulation protein YqfC